MESGSGVVVVVIEGCKGEVGVKVVVLCERRDVCRRKQKLIMWDVLHFSSCNFSFSLLYFCSVPFLRLLLCINYNKDNNNTNYSNINHSNSNIYCDKIDNDNKKIIIIIVIIAPVYIHDGNNNLASIFI